MIKLATFASAGSALGLGLLAAAAVAAAPAAHAMLPPGTPEFASLIGDPVAGKVAFNACRACHVVASGQNRIGPSLHDVVGAKSGSVPGFAYSAANKNSHIVWTEPVLYAYLLAPQAYLPGTSMAYAGLKNAQKRADVIAYLKTKPAS